MSARTEPLSHTAVDRIINKAVPFRCRLGWHRWAMWSDPTDQSITNYPFGKQVVSLSYDTVVPVQDRACLGCNTQQWRTVSRP